MRAIPWPRSSQKGGRFPFYGCNRASLVARDLAERNQPQKFWQNETNVDVSASHLIGGSYSRRHVAGRMGNRSLATDRCNRPLAHWRRQDEAVSMTSTDAQPAQGSSQGSPFWRFSLRLYR